MLFEGPDGLLWLKDLRSTNGTWVENERVNEAHLPLGASIRIGPARVEVLSYEADRDGSLTVMHSLVPANSSGASNEGKVLPFDPSRKKTKTQPSTQVPDKKRNAA